MDYIPLENLFILFINVNNKILGFFPYKIRVYNIFYLPLKNFTSSVIYFINL